MSCENEVVFSVNKTILHDLDPYIDNRGHCRQIKDVSLLKFYLHFKYLQVVFIGCAINPCFSAFRIVIKECFSFYAFESSWCF